MFAGPFIFVPMFRSLSKADNLTEKEKKKINDASRLGNLYFKQMKTTYVDVPIFALRMVSPFHNAIPLVPWL